ncbi:MAG: DUF1638 domain-containing protein [Anaerolineae bacterium]
MRFKLITCEVLARQVYYVAAFSPHIVDVELIGKGLHNEPAKLRRELQQRLDAVNAKDYDAVLLGYGLCSNSVVGLVCPHTPMVLPRAHDCITLYLGSRESYGEQFRSNPGTYWYTADYVERGGADSDRVALGASVDSKGMDETYVEYVEKYGQENADYLMEVMGAWQQHYNRAAYIETAEMPLPDYTAKIEGIATRRGWNFERLAGSFVLIHDLLEGRWDDERFLTIPPGNTITPSFDDRVVCDCPYAPCDETPADGDW